MTSVVFRLEARRLACVKLRSNSLTPSIRPPEETHFPPDTSTSNPP